MKRSDQLLQAMTHIGDDLIVMAEQQKFPRGAWQKLLPTAACVALVAAAAVVLKPLPRTAPATEAALPEESALVQRTDEPEAVPDVTYELMPEQEGWEKLPTPVYDMPEARPFYLYDPDPEGTGGPSSAIAPDGTVLLEVESGQILPLIDRSTGEYLAMAVCHNNGTLGDFTYDVYTLDGEPIAEALAAYDIDCLGQMVLVQRVVDGQRNAVLYDRTTGEVVREDFRSGIIYGDTLWMTSCEDSETNQEFFFADGSSIELHGQFSDLLVWNDRLYLITQAESGCGLLDSRGQELVPPVYTRIFGITDGYARCKDGDTYVLVELDSGEVAFRWPYAILQAWDNLVMVHQEGGTYALTDWSGNVLLEGSMIYTLDGEDAGTPALCAVVQEEQMLYVQPDGEVLAIAPRPEGNVVLLSEQTAAWLEPDETGLGELVLLNLHDGLELHSSARRYGPDLQPIEEDGRATSLLAAFYTEDGVERYDVIRADGTVLLEGIPRLWDRQGDVFYTDQNGGGLLRLDGSWLYRAGA